MKKLLIAVLLACCQAVSAQSIDQIIDGRIKASEAKQKAYTDSLFKVKGDGGSPQNPGNGLDSCTRGPVPTDVYNVTQSGATVLFDGEGVFGWDFSIIQNGIVKVTGNSGNEKLQRNTVPISYALAPGEYTIALKGNTCLSKVYTRTFTVPKATSENGNGSNGGNSGPPPVDGKYTYQIIMGTTGDGFDAKAEYGIDPQWVRRIEATKYSWGYGITGVCLWIPWDEYEPTPGIYEEAALKRALSFFEKRGLGFSAAFMRRRSQNDGFIRPDEYVTGSNGTVYYEGCCGTGKVYAGYANERVNALSAGAIKSIARIMATYPKSFYFALAGGGAGEQVNYVFNGKEFREFADFSADNERRYDAWRAPRGIAPPGRPPVIQGPGIDWPHVDYNDVCGVEFARFTTYGLRLAFDSFTEAVRSETRSLVCTYFYSVTSNLQFRSIANADIPYIAANADGIYGSDGDGINDNGAKDKVNSLNLGTLPGKVSMAEIDPDDISFYKANTGQMPPYCNGGLQYQMFETTTRRLFARGLMAMNLAMSWCEDGELPGLEPALKSLRQDYVGHEYKWPTVNASNTVTVNVTEKYRASQDLMEGIDVTKKYVKYTDEGFWGAESPQPSKDFSPVKSILEANAANYNWSYIFELKSPAGTLYSLQVGQYDKNSRLKVMSHSKFTTGVIIAYLIDQGKLSLDSKVGDVIKSVKGTSISEITIRQIMGHLSGIPDNQFNEGAKTLEEHVNWIAGLGLEFTPGSQFKYSTVSYQVVARMAEIVTGKKWKDLFKEILVDPCEMGQAEYNPVGTGDVKGNPSNPLAGYGLICSENEWMNFISMVRDGGVFKGRHVLNPGVFDILKTRTSPGWSDWGCGVMFRDGQYISEAATGLGTAILPFQYALTIFTQSSYESTYWSNRHVIETSKQIYEQ